jgi:hypothetical protein
VFLWSVGERRISWEPLSHAQVHPEFPALLSAQGDILFAPPATIYCGVPSADSARLRAGVDYPTDLSEFDRFFPDEAATDHTPTQDLFKGTGRGGRSPT